MNSVERELRLETPRAYVPLLAPNKRYRGARGGRGSAKSWFFAELIIDRLIDDPTLRVVCVREYQKSLDMSSKQLLEDTIKRFGVQNRFRILDTHIETRQGGIILFHGMSTFTAESIKSLEGFKIAWIEEAQSISERSLNLLRPTIRGENSEIYASWNPESPNDPIDKLLWNTGRDDVAIVHTTFRDNPFFPEVLRKEMLWDRQRDPDKYAHVWLGEYQQQSQARVFKNWRIEAFDEPENPMYYQGADWGYSVDPSTLVRMRVDGRKLFVRNEAYKVGVEIDHLPQFFDQVPNARKYPTIADSARPETISYMQRNGYPLMKKSIKGKDSVKEGVIFLQSYDIIVHPECEHTIDELSTYSYHVDKKTELITNVLEDKKNHIIDPMRYGTEPLRRNQGLTW